jgi:hypothetical protein
VFSFEVWLAGLLAVIAALAALSPFVFRGARWTRPAGYALGALMTLNALGHFAGTAFGRTVESVRLPGPMPGVLSSPLLLAASLYLLFELRRSARRIPTGGARACD